MAKHNREADEVMKGKHFGFLGKFRNREILERGHNRGELTSAKAKEILRDDEVGGTPLTAKQKRFFGAVAGGERPRRR